MSESTATPRPVPAEVPAQVAAPGSPSAPARSGWRRALIVFTLLGVAVFALGQVAAADESGRFPPAVMMFFPMLGPMLALLGFGLWWLFLGDFGRGKRLLLVLAAAAFAVAVVTLAEDRMKPFAAMWGVPLAAAITGLALAAVPAARGWPVVLVAAAAVSPWLALRNEGVTGSFGLQPSPRWLPSPTQAAEQQLADKATVVPTAASAPAESIVVSEADWPGFRGARRTGVVPAAGYRGWGGSAPKEKWRNNPVGPAWSSFCVAGDFLFTQEQRGESESVVCYRADTGKEVWARGDAGKHTDWASGSGPRATPTFANGKVFATTASGAVVALRADTGEPVWRVSLAERFGAAKPAFGLATSPLAVAELVIVNPASPGGPRLAALDASTGETKWQTDAKGTEGYSSPQLSTLHGERQVLVFNGAGLFGHDPATGRELWHYDWPTRQNEPVAVQPLVLPDGRVVIGGGLKGLGARCVEVRRDGGNWSAAEKWKTTRFTPVFNDVVAAGGHLFGLDGGRMVCVDLSNGSVLWKEGNYGSGQLLLVGDKIVGVTEEGKLVCVAAKPDEHEELWTVDAVKGKTWNHPAVARGRLFVRNATEMVAFDLPGFTGKE